MEQNLHYDSSTDLQEVDQYGFIDVTKCLQNGYVPGNNGVTDLTFDDCNDPSAIIGKPKDVFDAIRMQNAILDGISTPEHKGSSASADKSE